MGTVTHEKVETVHVGDTGPAYEFGFLKADGVTLRSLDGYAAWVTVWHAGSAPHVVRAAAVDETNDLVKYELQGDEYDAEGEVLIQATVMAPNVSATGRGFFETSFPAVRRIVKRKPT